jgi:hypothetical protein
LPRFGRTRASPGDSSIVVIIIIARNHDEFRVSIASTMTSPVGSA